MTPDTEPQSDFGRFISEMRRRHVVRFSIGYAAVAFVLLQLAEIVFPAFGIGEGGLRVLVAAVTLGFLPSVVLAWIYDLTKEGIRRTEEAPERRIPHRFTLAVFALTTIGLSGAVGWYLLRHGVLDSPVSVAATTTAAYDPSAPIRSLVVLPLQDFSPAGNEGYFASGMHDAIIAQLGTLEGVRVVSRTTSMRYASSTRSVPEIGSELGVDVVIEGSVNRSGDQVRITLQVIHAATDASIETLQIDGTADDLLSLQEAAARRVATVIGSTYGRSELGRTAEGIPRAAQDAYYQARYEMDRRTPEASRRALTLFEEAVRLAPRFAEARAGMAGALFRVALREDSVTRAQELDRAEREAARALALDSTSMEVREVYGLIRVARSRAGDGPRRQGDVALTGAGAVADSISIGVAAVEAMWLGTTTTLGQQSQEMLRDSTLEGADAAAQLTFEARVMMSRGGFSEAAERLDSIVEAFPQTQEAWDQLLRAHVALGHLDEAVQVVARWNAAGASGAPGPERLERLRGAVEREGTVGYWRWRRDYLVAEQEAGRPVVLTDLAAAHAAVGERQRAYALLDQALEAEELRLYAVPSDPVWDPLRGDARFRAIEEEIQRRRVQVTLSVGTADTGG